MRKKSELTMRELYIATQMKWLMRCPRGEWIDGKGWVDKPMVPRPPSAIRAMIKRRTDQKFLYNKVKSVTQRMMEGTDDPEKLLQDVCWGWEDGIRAWAWFDMKNTMLLLAKAEIKSEGKTDKQLKRMMILEAI